MASFSTYISLFPLPTSASANPPISAAPLVWHHLLLELIVILQTLVPVPRSFFMDVKCPGCFTITTVFSHAQTVVICGGCSTVLCQPTGGKARLTEGCSFRKK